MHICVVCRVEFVKATSLCLFRMICKIENFVKKLIRLLAIIEFKYIVTIRRYFTIIFNKIVINHILFNYDIYLARTVLHFSILVISTNKLYNTFLVYAEDS